MAHITHGQFKVFYSGNSREAGQDLSQWFKEQWQIGAVSYEPCDDAVR